jgi:hypothetical protein
MSRSIHATRQSLARLKKGSFSNPAAQEEAISATRFDLKRKRLIKRQVIKERRISAPADQRVPAKSIPILVADEGPGVLHAASVEDVRALLELLPPAAVQGIGEVRLCLGRAYMLERNDEIGGQPDPLTGRPGCRLFPGVHGGTVLGSYLASKGLIMLYGYVTDWERLLVPRAIVALYLRLLALKTLVHEIAHFHDKTARVQRGRWLADRHENLEWYAEKMEYQWTEQIVVPYLQRQYARECRVFRAWVQQRGGIGLPLGFFAGDDRCTLRNGHTRLVCSTAYAFENWLEQLPLCPTRHEARFALAWELHYADRYEECLTVLNGILGEDATHVKARGGRAHTLVHLERFDEAFTDAEAVLRVAPGENMAWEAMADVLVHRKDWAGLHDCCRRWELVPRVSPRKRRECFYYRAVACCALDDPGGMETQLAAYCATFRSKNPEAMERRLRSFRRAVFRWAGKAPPDDPPK